MPKFSLASMFVVMTAFCFLSAFGPAAYHAARSVAWDWPTALVFVGGCVFVGGATIRLIWR